jgi:tetratricopeptide (TPR) repeat protein
MRLKVLRTGKWFALLSLVITLAAPSWAAPAQDPLANPGFVHFYNNEYDQALADFRQELKAYPNDPEIYNHVAQTLLYREMFRDGVLESELVTGSNPFLRRPKMEMEPADRENLLDCIKKSIQLSQTRLKANPDDTGALYTLAVAHGLRANYLFLVEHSWMDALREATAARKADQRLLRLDPGFVDGQLILGLNEYVVGSLPFYVRAMGFIGGFHGDKEAGIRHLQNVAKFGTINRYDAKILLAVIYRREHRPAKAIPILQELAGDFPRNYLFRFEQVQMYSDLGDKRAALRVLDEVSTLRKDNAPGYAQIPAEKIAYLRGNLLFWYGDLDPALANLKTATRNPSEVDLNTAVMAWLRLGQVYDLRGSHQQAVHAYRETIKTAPGSDIAAEARNYITSPYRRTRTSG